MQDPRDPNRTLSQDEVADMARRDVQDTQKLFKATTWWRAPIKGRKLRQAALNDLVEKSKQYANAGEPGAGFVLAETAVKMAGQLPERQRGSIVSAGLNSMDQAAANTYLNIGDYPSARAMMRGTVELAEQLGQKDDVSRAYRRQNALDEQARAEGVADFTATQPGVTAPPAGNPAQQPSLAARQTVARITAAPANAIDHAEQYFAAAPQAAIREPSGQTVNKTADALGGGQIIGKMLEAAEIVRSVDPLLAFQTAMRAQELAVQNLPDGAARTALREKSFTTMGRIVALTADDGNSQLANAMYERADAAAGPIYRAAIARGTSSTMTAEQQATAANRRVEAAHLAGLEEGLRHAGRANGNGQPQPAATTGLDARPPQAEPLAAGLGARPLQAEPVAPPADNVQRARLSAVGQSPMAAPQQPGLGTKILSGVKTTIKWGIIAPVVIAGAIGGAQFASVKIGNESSWPIWGVRSVDDNHYRDLKSVVGSVKAFEHGFGGLSVPGTIGMPRTTANMDQNPSAREAAIALARREGAEAEATRLRQEAARKGGVVAPNGDEVAKLLTTWRREHPTEFTKVYQLAPNDAAGALIEMSKTAPQTLTKSMGDLLTTQGLTGFSEPLHKERVRAVIEARATKAPQPASGPTR